MENRGWIGYVCVHPIFSRLGRNTLYRNPIIQFFRLRFIDYEDPHVSKIMSHRIQRVNGMKIFGPQDVASYSLGSRRPLRKFFALSVVRIWDGKIARWVRMVG
jgi:hypothetical protein